MRNKYIRILLVIALVFSMSGAAFVAFGMPRFIKKFTGKKMDEKGIIHLKHIINTQPTVFRDKKSGKLAIAYPMAPVNKKGSFKSDIPIGAYWLDGTKHKGFPPSMLLQINPLFIYWGNQLTSGDIDGDGSDEVVAVGNTGQIWIFNSEGAVKEGHRTAKYIEKSKGDDEDKYFTLPPVLSALQLEKKSVPVMHRVYRGKFEVVNLKGEMLPGFPIKLGKLRYHAPVYVGKDRVYYLTWSGVIGIDIARAKVLAGFPVNDERLNYRLVEKALRRKGTRNMMAPHLCVYNAGKTLAVSTCTDTLLIIDALTGKKSEQKIAGAKKITGIARIEERGLAIKSEMLAAFDEETKSILIINAKGIIKNKIPLAINNLFQNCYFEVVNPDWGKDSYIFMQFFHGKESRAEQLFDEWIGKDEAKKIEAELVKNFIDYYKTDKFDDEIKSALKKAIIEMKDQTLRGKFGDKYYSEKYSKPVIKTVGMRYQPKKHEMLFDREFEDYYTTTPDEGPGQLIPINRIDSAAKMIYHIVPINRVANYAKTDQKLDSMIIVHTIECGK